MYIFNTGYPKAHLVQGYPPVVPTAECRLCGEKVRLTPIEVLTNHAELESGSYVCPLCRRLMAEAENSIPDGQDLSDLFPGSTMFPFNTRPMNEMEDQHVPGTDQPGQDIDPEIIVQVQKAHEHVVGHNATGEPHGEDHHGCERLAQRILSLREHIRKHNGEQKVQCGAEHGPADGDPIGIEHIGPAHENVMIGIQARLARDHAQGMERAFRVQHEGASDHEEHRIENDDAQNNQEKDIEDQKDPVIPGFPLEHSIHPLTRCLHCRAFWLPGWQGAPGSVRSLT